MTGKIYVGIGGWTYEPWRGTFYPEKLPHARELEHAGTRVTAIEINGTYYRLQSAKSFAGWAKAVPDGFKFSVKASRYCTNRKVLAEAGESIEKFVGQGLVELGDRLGPILWQFATTKQYDPDDFKVFVDLLPASHDGVKLRHAVEPRHESFRDPGFVAMLRKAGVGLVFADATDHPCFADLTGNFVYARLQDAKVDEATGYAPKDLDRWTGIAQAWAKGEAPEGLPYAGAPDDSAGKARDTFVFMINGAKLRAPAAAEAMLAKLKL